MEAIEEAKEAALRDVEKEGVPEALEKALVFLRGYGVKLEHVERLLGKGSKDFTSHDISVLRNYAWQIKDEPRNVDDLFRLSDERAGPSGGSQGAGSQKAPEQARESKGEADQGGEGTNTSGKKKASQNGKTERSERAKQAAEKQGREATRGKDHVRGLEMIHRLNRIRREDSLESFIFAEAKFIRDEASEIFMAKLRDKWKKIDQSGRDVEELIKKAIAGLGKVERVKVPLVCCPEYDGGSRIKSDCESCKSREGCPEVEGE